MPTPTKLLREAGLIRKSLVGFAMLTAALNGMVTASVGAWLAQTYHSFQSRRASVTAISDLIYERRTRAGMVISSLRRGADIEELRTRKRDYDEVFVSWNKKIQTNVLQIREVMGARETTPFESMFQELLVPAMTEVDGCLTKAYDVRLRGEDPLPVIEGCRFAQLHQFVLDCGSQFTDELYALTRLSFMPFSGNGRRELEAAQIRIAARCTRSSPTTAAPAPAPVQPSDARAETAAPPAGGR